MRLIDLHNDWLLQYAPASTDFDSALYPGIADRYGQADGYLQATSAAILSCYRRASDWSSRADPWSALHALVTRIEAEFPGRVLRDPADLARWRDDPGSLAWALIGVEGFDALARTEADLDRLGDLWRKGVRLFQPTYGATGLLAGSSVAGDDRGLTDLGRRFLERLDALSDQGPRPILDLAHLNPTSASEVLTWLESHPGRLIPAYSHGALRHDAYPSPRAITLDNLTRLRALGGTIGFGVSPPFYSDPDQIRAGIEAAAAVPFQGRPGFEGIALGTDFLGVTTVLPGLGDAESVVAWAARTFPPDVAAAIVAGNGESLIAQALGGPGIASV